MAALEKDEAEAGDRPTVEGAPHAFLDTDLDLYIEGGEPWMKYGAICTRVSHSREGAAMLVAHFDPVVLKLLGKLKRALPDCSDEDIFSGLLFRDGRADEHAGAHRTDRSSLGRRLSLRRFPHGQEAHRQIHGGRIPRSEAVMARHG
jgi:hypothetical protein